MLYRLSYQFITNGKQGGMMQLGLPSFRGKRMRNDTVIVFEIGSILVGGGSARKWDKDKQDMCPLPLG